MDKDRSMFRFVHKFVPAIEGGDEKTRYSPTFSIGKSGMSIGLMQNDVRTNPTAKRAWEQMLSEGNFDDVYRKKLFEYSQADEPERNRRKAQGLWTNDDESRITELLNRPENKELINTLDDTQADIIARNLETLVGRIQDRAGGARVLNSSNPDMKTLARLAAWHNRTNGLTLTQEYLMSAPGPLTAEAVSNILAGHKQFLDRELGGVGEDYRGWSNNIDDAFRRTEREGW